MDASPARRSSRPWSTGARWSALLVALFVLFVGSATLSAQAAPVEIAPVQELVIPDEFEIQSVGMAVAVDGDTMVVGGRPIRFSGESGAFVYTRSGAGWTLDTQLNPVTQVDRNFGHSVAISGDTIVVGQEDASAIVFTRVGGEWVEQDQLVSPNGDVAEDFGGSLAIDGDTIVVTDANSDSELAPTVHVYTRSGEVWSEQDSFAVQDGGFRFPVAIDGEMIIVGDAHNNAAYVFERNGSMWSQQSTLTGSLIDASGAFGSSVSIDGDVAVVGAPNESDRRVNDDGAAFVFERAGSRWVEQQRLTPFDFQGPSNFGEAVAIDGTTIAVADSATAKIFRLSGGSWSNDFVLAPEGGGGFGSSAVAISGSDVVLGRSGASSDGEAHAFDIDGISANAEVLTRSSPERTSVQEILPLTIPPTSAQPFGVSIDVDGDLMAIGAPGDPFADPSEVGVYERVGDTWQLHSRVAAPNEELHAFGSTVAISDNILAVGAPLTNVGDDGFQEGSVVIFELVDDTWVERDTIVSSDVSVQDNFGEAIAVDDGTVVVGVWRKDFSGIFSAEGATYVFERSGNEWEEEAILIASDAAEAARFGISVDIDGDTIIIGSNGANDTGAAYVFTREETWTERAKLIGSELTSSANFGWSVGIDSGTIVVGAFRDDFAGREDAGSAYVFTGSGASWTEQATLAASDSSHFDEFGTSVAIDGDIVVVGEPVATRDGIDRAGSVYVFERQGGLWTETLNLVAGGPIERNRLGGDIAIEGNSVVASADAAAVAQGSGSVHSFTLDGDGDGFRLSNDCDDRDGAAFPGAAEIADDGIDQDCDGQDTVTPAPLLCDGQVVTVNLALGQVPTAGNDVILGTDAADTINAGDGHDVICAGDGDDIINAGNGADTVFAGAGDDTVQAGQGRDTIRGEGGDDFISGGRGKDTLIGGAGADDLRGNEGTDTLDGGAGADELRGGQKADVIMGGGGADRLVGGTRPDLLDGGAGADTLVGGAGADMLEGSGGVDTLDGGRGLDSYNGGAGNDTCLADPAGLFEQRVSCES